MRSRRAPVSVHFGPDRYGESLEGRDGPNLLKPILVGLAALILVIAAGLGGFALYHWWPEAKPKAEPVAASAPAEKPAPPPGPAELQDSIHQIAQTYGEPVGIAVSDVKDGWVVGVQGDRAFPQMSVSKLWVAITVLQAVDQGELTLEQPVTLTKADRSVFNQPIAYLFEDESHTMTVAQLIRHAIVNSDNAANDKLMSLVGVEGVNALLTDKNLEGIRLGADEKNLQAQIAGLEWTPAFIESGEFERARSRLPMDVREQAMQAYLQDPLDGATPDGIAFALADLRNGQILSLSSTNFLLETMADVRTGARRLKGGLPAGWSLAHKTGTGQDLKNYTVGYNDVGLLTAPDGKTYSVAVMIQKTEKPVPARIELMQAVSRAVVDQWERDRLQAAWAAPEKQA